MSGSTSSPLPAPSGVMSRPATPVGWIPESFGGPASQDDLAFVGTHASPDFNNQSVHAPGFQPFSHSEGPLTNDTPGENINYGCRLATIFNCSFYNRGFSRNTSRNTHEKKHSFKRVSEYLYTVSDYDRRFEDKNHLNRYMKSVNQIRYKDFSLFLRFSQIHIKTERFICDQYDKIFYRRDNLVQYDVNLLNITLSTDRL